MLATLKCLLTHTVKILYYYLKHFKIIKNLKIKTKEGIEHEQRNA